MDASTASFNSRLVVALLGLVYASHLVSGLVFEVPQKAKFCIYEQFNGTNHLKLQFRVVRGAKRDIDMWLESPLGKILYRVDRKSRGEFEFATSLGNFSFCFSNEFSRITAKRVFFQLDGYQKPIYEVPSVPTAAEAAVLDIQSRMEKVMMYQHHYRLSEMQDRLFSEDLYQRVSLWAAIHTSVILLAAIGQIFFLKKLFSTKPMTSKRNIIETPSGIGT